MATCHVCPPQDNRFPDDEFMDHLRVHHPDVYSDGPERWPDGTVVIYDHTLSPVDFDAPEAS